MRTQDVLDTCLAFYPASEGEAADIMRALFSHGVVWSSGLPEVKHLRECVRDGMTAADGQIFVGVDPRDGAQVTTLAELTGQSQKPAPLQSSGGTACLKR